MLRPQLTKQPTGGLLVPLRLNEFGARDADLHADGRAGAACRRQVPTPIRQENPLRATEKVVYTAYARVAALRVVAEARGWLPPSGRVSVAVKAQARPMPIAEIRRRIAAAKEAETNPALSRDEEDPREDP